ncbi:MAG TPA: hypothetical protein VLM19_04515, partial [Nitrospiraceae bacterium]|nr:hypothetical protein [Nitrospiraceae bacterium]
RKNLSRTPLTVNRFRHESARARVPREAYLVSRMRRHGHTHSALRFTLHERRATKNAAAYQRLQQKLS